MTIMDHTNNLCSEIQFNPDRKGTLSSLFGKAATPSDFFKGSIDSVYRSHPMYTNEGLNAIYSDGKRRA